MLSLPSIYPTPVIDGQFFLKPALRDPQATPVLVTCTLAQSPPWAKLLAAELGTWQRSSVPQTPQWHNQPWSGAPPITAPHSRLALL